MTPEAIGHLMAVQIFAVCAVLGTASLARAVLRGRAGRPLSPRLQAFAYVLSAPFGTVIIAFLHGDPGAPAWWLGVATAVPLAIVGAVTSARAKLHG